MEKLMSKILVFPKHFLSLTVWSNFPTKNFKYEVFLGIKIFQKPKMDSFLQISTNLEKLQFQTSIFPDILYVMRQVIGPIFKKSQNPTYLWGNPLAIKSQI